MNAEAPTHPTNELVQSGISGLDQILGGGFPTNHLYLIEGNPGSGKTTLGLRFLLEGVRQGEKGMYVTLSETRSELLGVAESHGWSLDGIELHELAPSEDLLEPEAQYTMFQPSEVELSVTTKAILEHVERHQPKRVVLDSLSEMRLLAQSPLRYRRQILALKQFFAGRQCTLLLLDDRTSESGDLQLESIAHGVIDLQQLAPEYGAERRRLRVIKMRGVQYGGGYHDFVIRKGGLQVFPRFVAADHGMAKERGQLSSGMPGLDQLLGGGIERGTSVLLMGPAGVGKSSMAVLYAFAAAGRGERSTLFAFDESCETLMTRAAGLGMELAPYVETGLISIVQVDPGELSPGEFADRVYQEVLGRDGDTAVRVIIIDSLNGYLNAMPEERFLLIQLHELLTYLGNHGVVTFMVVAEHGLVGQGLQSPIDASYIADAVVLFRYLELGGEMRQVVSIVKKRRGAHERTIREYRMHDGRIAVGEPIRNLRGVLSGAAEPYTPSAVSAPSRHA